eukprot:c32643_g1_i1.p1 GENE.c32643_g1_i1~~c32643_g1_i1.p1  ORF type:complete len:282 (+),score=59.19 c32643_g1_i1:68-847(+)
MADDPPQEDIRLDQCANIQLLVRKLRKPPPEGIEVKDRKYRLKTYKQTFIGAELVDWLLEYFHVKNPTNAKREQAIVLAQRLMDQGLISPAKSGGPSAFEDDFVFYTLAAPGSDAVYGCAADISGEDIEHTDEQLVELLPRMFAQDEQGVAIADRRFRLRKYVGVFIASEAVDWVCLNLHCSRPKAVAICERMQDAEIFDHASSAGRKIDDSYAFYRLNTPEEAPMSFYDFTMNNIDGIAVPLANFRGRVVLVVNVASF